MTFKATFTIDGHTTTVDVIEMIVDGEEKFLEEGETFLPGADDTQIGLDESEAEKILDLFTEVYKYDYTFEEISQAYILYGRFHTQEQNRFDFWYPGTPGGWYDLLAWISPEDITVTEVAD